MKWLPFIARIVLRFIPCEDRPYVFRELKEECDSLGSFLRKALSRIYGVNAVRFRRTLETSRVFEVERMGYLIVLGAFFAGAAELPGEVTPRTIVVDQLCGALTIPLLIYWYLKPARRKAWTAALMTCLIFAQAVVIVLSVFPPLGFIYIDEAGLSLMLLSMAIVLTSKGIDLWKGLDRFESIPEFGAAVRAKAVAIRGYLVRDPLRWRVLAILTVGFVADTLLPRPAAGEPIGLRAAFEIGIRVAPLVLCVMYALRQTRARDSSLEVILLLLVMLQLGSIVLTYGGIISPGVFRIVYRAILFTLVCFTFLRVRNTASIEMPPMSR